jgi:3-hydroxyisobutyrate dehydrogenase-like beta-hydroxyacid dehydrogenase
VRFATNKDATTVSLTLCSNFIVAGTMEIVGEAQVLAEKSDLGTDMLEKLLELNFGSLMHSSSTRMTQGVYIPEEGLDMASITNARLFVLC